MKKTYRIKPGLLKGMAPAEAQKRRRNYAYPAVGLKYAAQSPIHVEFKTTASMDQFYSLNLNSISRSKIISGYLSVIYWGHYSGKAGIIKASRALSKVRMAKRHPNYIHAHKITRTARTLLRKNQIAAAVIHLTRLPQIQFAFASKLCAFLAPEKCGVIDSVIAKNHKKLGFKVNQKGYITTRLFNANHYEQYCQALQRQASRLNRLGKNFRWRDRDGAAYKWRALDVERAIY